ncbi:MAG: hypothetical protein NNA18_02220 [Nitrospira sp.]|nr:hypothetical protein [Nitrospira sp.]
MTSLVPPRAPIPLISFAIVMALLSFTVGCVPRREGAPAHEPLPYVLQLDISPSVQQGTFRYTDSCGRLAEVAIGHQIDRSLREEAARTFQTVISEPTQNIATPPDHIMTFDVREWSFNIDKDTLYDRAPATLRLTAIVKFSDPQGRILRATEFRVDRRERLRLEQVGRNCDYIVAPFVRDTAVELATKVFLDARLAFAEQPTPSAAGETGSFATHESTPSPSPLRFKAVLLDENGNLVFESGEHVRVRIDVINTGMTSIQNVSASLSGTPAMIDLFPSTTLTLPSLQPGQTKSLEFMATLPPTLQPIKAEIRVTLTESGNLVAQPQTISLTIQPADAAMEEIDQLPAPTTVLRQPWTSLIAIGVGTYRDPRIPSRKYAVRDAQTVAAYLQAIGGVPSSNIQLLLDTNALRRDVEKILTVWLPPRGSSKATVIIYFAGTALVDARGQIFLALHDSIPLSADSLLPLDTVASHLSKLNADHLLFIFDGPMSSLPPHTSTASPRWDLTGTMIHFVSGETMQAGLEDDNYRHGLFTYFLLRGLRGEADTNHNGAITLEEVANYVRQKVRWSSQSRFHIEQRPMVLPPLVPDSKAASLILSAPPSRALSSIP